MRIVAVSLDGLEDTARSQEKFPHLVVLSDGEQTLTRAAEVLAPQHSPAGGETAAPTTILIDRQGQVRWVFRPDYYLHRLSPDELLAALQKHLRTEG